MAQMIQIRQRIKAIETIKKITHAMRLISMSSHTKLKGLQEPLFAYKNQLSHLFATIKHYNQNWIHPIFNPTSVENKHLVILVGSQKGLCGNFNNTLFYFFDDEIRELNSAATSFIAIGKKAVEHLQKKGIVPLATYKSITATTIDSIARSIIHDITNAQAGYSSVTLFANCAKTFFMQKPQKHTLIPFTAEGTVEQTDHTDDYYWEQSIDSILNKLAEYLMATHLHAILFDSLLAEQAARFISMDGATRNADNLLEQTRLTYNKLRQFNITKELAELMGNF